MGRRPCCSKEGLNRGAWSAREDKILTDYINVHGEGKWRDLPKRAGLKRCGKSCRLRWLNYLRPDIKRGNITHAEEDLIVRLHKLLGNRWSLIAGRLPGRTDNEIKNYWNTSLGKKVEGGGGAGGGVSFSKTNLQRKRLNRSKAKNAAPIMAAASATTQGSTSPKPPQTTHNVIRTKAIRCTKILSPPKRDDPSENQTNPDPLPPVPAGDVEEDDDGCLDLFDDLDVDELISRAQEFDFLQACSDEGTNRHEEEAYGSCINVSSCRDDDHRPFLTEEGGILPAEEDWRDCLQPTTAVTDLMSLASFLDYSGEEWLEN